MEEKKLTVEEVLDMTVRQMSEISVPAGMIDQIGIPLARAIGNLNAVLDALRANKEAEGDGRETDAE